MKNPKPKSGPVMLMVCRNFLHRYNGAYQKQMKSCAELPARNRVKQIARRFAWPERWVRETAQLLRAREGSKALQRYEVKKLRYVKLSTPPPPELVPRPIVTERLQRNGKWIVGAIERLELEPTVIPDAVGRTIYTYFGSDVVKNLEAYKEDEAAAGEADRMEVLFEYGSLLSQIRAVDTIQAARIAMADQMEAGQYLDDRIDYGQRRKELRVALSRACGTLDKLEKNL